MIVTRLMGGLGNQMFQYAAGKALAKRLGVPLKLDRTFLDQRSENPGYTLRDFELDVFRVDAAIATNEEVRRFRRPLDNRFYRRARQIFPSAFPDHTFREKGKKYNREFETLRDPVYLDGFWQCEKYFNSIADELRNEFMPVKEIDAQNKEVLGKISAAPSVSIHVRRSDYITNPGALQFHGVCSVEYYEKAAKEIAEKTGAESFFVFSDEPEWVKENIRLPYSVTYVSNNKGRDSYWDLFLMRNCKHHIIANSSFSWWGAWLDPSPDKMVIAPEKWFNDPASQDNDIIPPGWIKR